VRVARDWARSRRGRARRALVAGFVRERAWVGEGEMGLAAFYRGEEGGERASGRRRVAGAAELH
jgi:hypothetical protein